MNGYLEDNTCMGQRTIAYTYLMMPHSVIGATEIMCVCRISVYQLRCLALRQRQARMCACAHNASFGNPPKSQDVDAWSLAITWPSLRSVDCTVRPTHDYTMGKAILSDSHNRSCYSCTQYTLHMCGCVYLQLRKPTYGSVSPQVHTYATNIAYHTCKAVSLQLPKVLTN